MDFLSVKLYRKGSNELKPSTSSKAFGRRQFFRGAGIAAGGAAALVLAEGSFKPLAAQVQGAEAMDTAAEIFTAALIAEDLATTFYYNGLVGMAVQDPNLAGPGGTAAKPSAGGNIGNLEYVQAALTQEISHANLLRSLIGGASAATDPYQTFYFPAGTFNTLTAFLTTLNALENAFVGAYLSAVREFAYMAAVTAKVGQGAYLSANSQSSYTTDQLQYFAQVAASIMAIEQEHRVLGRVISNTNPSNNLTYAQLSGIGSVYNGLASAVAALTPFLSPSTGPAYSLQTALANQSTVSLPSTGNPPSF
jgi:hypothetical protein